MTIFASAVFAEGISQSELDAIFAGWLKREQLDDSITCSKHRGDKTVTGTLKYSDLSSEGYVYRHQNLLKIADHSITRNYDDHKVLNDKYAFILVKNSGQQNWTLEFVNQDLTSGDYHKLNEMLRRIIYVYPNSLVVMSSTSNEQLRPSELIQDQNFIITKRERKSDHLEVLSFKYRFVSGELECNPSNDYAIMRGTSIGVGVALTVKIQYENIYEERIINGSKVAVVVKHTYRNQFSNGDASVYTVTLDYPTPDPTEISEDQFRLTAYGIPEPEGIIWDKPRSWFLYYLIAGGTFLFVASSIILRRIRQKSIVEQAI
jgi:hypothetical protein